MKAQILHTYVPVYKNKRQGRVIAYSDRINPANWSNDFENIKATLEEFDSIKKGKPKEINTFLKKESHKNIFTSSLTIAISQKNYFKISCMIAFILLSSAAVFAQYVGRPDNKKSLKKQNGIAITEVHTPVYLGHKNQQVAILETDFPKVAARFSKAFPAADRQLWIKEDNALFVYFLNNGNKVSAVFTSRGSMSYAVTLLNASSVPEDIGNKIKEKYSSLSFFSAKKIQAGGYTAYELVFENPQEYIMLSTTDNDEIVVTGRTRKTTANKNHP